MLSNYVDMSLMRPKLQLGLRYPAPHDVLDGNLQYKAEEGILRLQVCLEKNGLATWEVDHLYLRHLRELIQRMYGMVIFFGCNFSSLGFGQDP